MLARDFIAAAKPAVSLLLGRLFLIVITSVSIVSVAQEPQLEAQVQDLKEQILELNKDLFILKLQKFILAKVKNM